MTQLGGMWLTIFSGFCANCVDASQDERASAFFIGGSGV